MTAAFKRSRWARTRRLEKQATSRNESNLANHVASRRLRQSRRKTEITKMAVRISIALVVFMIIVVGSAFAYFAKDLPTADGIRNRPIDESTKIYARDGKTILFEIFGEERRTSIPFEEIPDNVKKATVAIEDDDFYRHHGVDFRGILRAVYNNFTGGSVQGGSTITQQLVKNAILTSERTLTRKVKEVILAIEIEQKFSKDEILGLYLNEIPYGSNAYGIEAAAQTYFDKEAKELTLAESALVASLPQSPTRLSPFGPNKEELLGRKDFVLERMEKLGMITQEEMEDAQKEELAFTKQKIEIKAPHFVFWVKELLVEKYGENVVERGGLKVTTSLDPKLQEIAEKAVREGAKRNEEQYGAQNAALVAIEPKTGQVMAYVGSRDYFSDEIDGSVDIPRSMQQVGSSFKPYEYAVAFAKGYPPSTMLHDLVTDFGGNYKPLDYDKGQRGFVSMRSALQMSLNIPAVETTYLAGLDNVLDFVHKLGVSDLNDRDSYGLAIGLGAGEIKLVDHVYAFSTFGNEGRKVPRTAIIKVEDPSGKILEEWTQTDGEQVMDRNVALTLNNVLSDDGARAPIFGAGGPLTLPDRKVAAKSGTTENNTDGLAIGYVPQLATGIWVGNNDNKPFPGGDGSFSAGPIFHEFMVNALKDTEAEWYADPESIPAGKPVLAGKPGGKGEKIRISKIDGKRAPADLPENYVEEKEFTEYHSILHYVEKDNPQGPYPSNPESDPMYKNWEAAVKGHKKKDGEPPKETSPFGAAEVQPKISIIQPSAGSIVTSNNVTVVASVTAVAGLGSVTFSLDGTVVGSTASEPFAVTFSPSTSNGFHTLSANVTDKYGGKAETSIDIQVQVDGTPPTAVLSMSPAGVIVNVDGGGSSDNVGVVSYSWDFGDGASASGVTASHTYAPGTYTITLTVADAAGNTNNTTTSVTIP